MSDLTLLGRAPRPTDGAELVSRIVTLLLAADASSPVSSDRVSAEIEGPDVTRLSLDLSGFSYSTEKEYFELSPEGDVVSTEAGTVRDVRVVAAPMHVDDVDVTLDLALQSVFFRWKTTDAGELAVALGPDTEFNSTGPELEWIPQWPPGVPPLRGSVLVSVPHAQLLTVLERGVTETLGGHGFALADLALDLSQTAERAFTASFEAKVKKGILGAKITGGAVLTIGEDSVGRFSNVKLRSSNPLVAGLLLLAREEIEAMENEEMNFVESLPPGTRLESVRFSSGEHDVLELVFA